MEGRTIARPDWICSDAYVSRSRCLQWRAGQLPGQTLSQMMIFLWAGTLQWRAGQLPGQTLCRQRLRPRAALPSMEGRTIARPDLPTHASTSTSAALLQWRAGQLPGQTPRHLGGDGTALQPSMEGRTIARPDHDWHHERPRVLVPSMEGRTIARPDTRPTLTHPRRITPFNGGPDNCPARPLA